MSRILLFVFCALLGACSATPSSPSPLANREVERGQEHYEAFRYAEAAAAFRSAERLQPGDAGIRDQRLLAELLAGERPAEFEHPVEILRPDLVESR